MPTRSLVALALLALAACNSPPAPSAVAEPSIVVSASAPPAGPSAAPAPTTTASPALSPTEAANLLASAEKCFADPACDPKQAEDMYRRADDAGAKDVSCFDFYYGIHVRQDLQRARACFERQVAAGGTCGGSSPDLSRAYLAAMLIDAQGGPADAARATALFTGCFADATVKGLGEEAPQRSALAPDRKPLDFCADIGGTTITIGQCEMVEARKAKGLQQRVDRELAAKLDAAGMALAGKAREAYRKFADKQGEAAADRYRGGSLQGNAWQGRQNALEKQRIEALAHLFAYKLGAGGDPARAERDLDKAYREAAEGDAQHKKLLGAARKAWNAYRDAEIALYVHVFGATMGKREVEQDVKAMLATRYKAELEDMLKP